MTAIEVSSRQPARAPERRQDSALAFQRIMSAIRPYVFLLPFLVSFIAFTVIPLAYAIYMSLFRTPLIGSEKFVGLSNYTQVFHDSEFWSGVLRLFIFGLIQIPITLIIALIFALIFDLSVVRRTGSIYRLIYFIPYAIPGVISAFMWGYLYDPFLSPLNAITSHFGLGSPNVVSSSLVLWAIGNIVVWEYLGYNMIILYVSLRATDPELVDAAIIDGAGLWKVAWYVKIPLIRMAIFLTSVLSIIGTLQLFTEPEIMTAFSSTVSSSYTPNILIYNTAFTEQNIPYAAAMSIVVGGITIIASAIFLTVTNIRRRTEF
jgi:multiple sugar transport system permease protein